MSSLLLQIGLPDALDLSLTGKNVRADKAKRLGLVDLLVERGGGEEEMLLVCLIHIHVDIICVWICRLGREKVSRSIPYHFSPFHTISLHSYSVSLHSILFLSIPIPLHSIPFHVGPGIKPVDERNIEYLEEVAVGVAR